MDRQSEGAAVTLAVVSSLFFAILFWVWERDLIWMLAVILPPIWSPVIYRHYANDPRDASRATDRLVVAALVSGLAVLLGIALLTYALR